MNKIKIIEDIIVNLKGITDNMEALAELLNESVNPKEVVPKEDTEKETKAETKEKKVPKPTLEKVREAMAEKSKAGHREEVKAVLLKYGANKLTALDPKHYVEVLKEVGEIK